MNYIEKCGIGQGRMTDLNDILTHREEVTVMFQAAVASCGEHGTKLPAIMKAKGERMLANPSSVKAFMVFLRACARKEDCALLCKKGGVIKDGKQTTKSMYQLLM